MKYNIFFQVRDLVLAKHKSIYNQKKNNKISKVVVDYNSSNKYINSNF